MNALFITLQMSLIFYLFSNTNMPWKIYPLSKCGEKMYICIFCVLTQQ